MHRLSHLIQQGLKGGQHGVASLCQHVLKLPLGVEDDSGVGQNHVGTQEDTRRVSLQVPSSLCCLGEQALHQRADVCDVASGYDFGLQACQQSLHISIDIGESCSMSCAQHTLGKDCDGRNRMLSGVQGDVALQARALTYLHREYGRFSLVGVMLASDGLVVNETSNKTEPGRRTCKDGSFGSDHGFNAACKATQRWTVSVPWHS